MLGRRRERNDHTRSFDSSRTYRPDIDGLRAVAVAAVILFHAEIPGFSGGYIGVDVFYVISGYLITQLLTRSPERPLHAQLAEFYVRRARRILPALLATSSIVAAAAVAVLLPWDLARFGRYLAATAVLGTNVAAWSDKIGYFQSKLAHVPITHFWSIAIEEQFYVIYPITLAVISKYFHRDRATALAVLAIGSFGVCVWGSYHSPAANYYLAPSRAWELLLGGILASSGARPPRWRLTDELLAACSAIALGIAVFRFGPTTHYPGWCTIVPCAATAILIHTGRCGWTRVGKLLSLRPVVFTGLISYSLYLWHFPLLQLFSYYNIRRVGPLGIGLLLGLVYIVAVISWKWVETPIRTRAVLKSDRSFLWPALITSLVILVVGAVLWRSGGLPGRYPPEVRARGGEWLFDSEILTRCANTAFDKIAAGQLCSFGPQDNDSARALVWGDSHAMALLPAYERLAMSHHLRLYFAVRSSCRPLLSPTVAAAGEAARVVCAQFNAAVAQAVLRLDPRLLILNAHWVDTDADFSGGLRETLRVTASRDRTVCVVLDVPTYKYDVPTALGVARKRGISEDFLELTRAAALRQYRATESDIRALERQGALRLVDPKDLLCGADFCKFESGGNLLYWDADHLSWAGAQFVAPVIDGCFRNLGNAPPNRERG
jgi:peptidoglycan/LPS O-acetylase OafA/YrhL